MKTWASLRWNERRRDDARRLGRSPAHFRVETMTACGLDARSVRLATYDKRIVRCADCMLSPLFKAEGPIRSQ